MMSTLSGYGQYVEEVKNEDGSTKTEGKDDAAETFLYEGLSKVYKMNNICDSDNLNKCGIPTSITTMTGDTLDFPKKLSELNPQLIFDGKNSEGDDVPYGPSDISKTDTKVAAFETVNGESVAVFYNPNCKNNSDELSIKDEKGGYFYTQNKMCVNFIYDLNGLKGPNKVGRDIGFITALYAKNSEVVAPVPFENNVDDSLHTQQEAVELCANYSDDSRLPNKHELSSLFYNKILIGNLTSNGGWSSSVVSSTQAWNQGFGGGDRHIAPCTRGKYVRCIRK